MSVSLVGNVTLRMAQPHDVMDIVRLVNGYAAEAIMLYRTPESVAMALHNFVVAVDETGSVIACGSLKEYSPSIAEVAAVAVARHIHGHGLGRAVVQAVEQLAQKREIGELFALTLTPQFFESLGYRIVERAMYPEKIRRDCLKCPRRIRCTEYCVSRTLQAEMAVAA